MHDVRIRLVAPGDRAAVDAIQRAAFGDRGEVVTALIGSLRRTGAVAAEHLAELDGAPVGHVALSRGWVDARGGIVEVRVLSPLGVLPGAQRRGVGRSLVEHAVAACEADGAPAVFLEGDPAYYSRSGFVEAGPAGFTAPSWRIPARAFQVRTLPAHEPWMTGALVHPDAFWALGAIGPD